MKMLWMAVLLSGLLGGEGRCRCRQGEMSCVDSADLDGLSACLASQPSNLRASFRLRLAFTSGDLLSPDDVPPLNSALHFAQEHRIETRLPRQENCKRLKDLGVCLRQGLPRSNILHCELQLCQERDQKPALPNEVEQTLVSTPNSTTTLSPSSSQASFHPSIAREGMGGAGGGTVSTSSSPTAPSDASPPSTPSRETENGRRTGRIRPSPPSATASRSHTATPPSGPPASATAPPTPPASAAGPWSSAAPASATPASSATAPASATPPSAPPPPSSDVVCECAGETSAVAYVGVCLASVCLLAVFLVAVMSLSLAGELGIDLDALRGSLAVSRGARLGGDVLSGAQMERELEMLRKRLTALEANQAVPQPAALSQPSQPTQPPAIPPSDSAAYASDQADDNGKPREQTEGINIGMERQRLIEAEIRARQASRSPLARLSRSLASKSPSSASPSRTLDDDFEEAFEAEDADPATPGPEEKVPQLGAPPQASSEDPKARATEQGRSEDGEAETELGGPTGEEGKTNLGDSKGEASRLAEVLGNSSSWGAWREPQRISSQEAEATSGAPAIPGGPPSPATPATPAGPASPAHVPTPPIRRSQRTAKSTSLFNVASFKPQSYD